MIKVLLKLISYKSNCRYKLGCIVFSRGGISIGWNTCHDEMCIHAEVTALSVIPKELRENSTVYCSWSPCKDCEQYMRDNKIKQVYYFHTYSLNTPPEFSKQLKWYQFK